MLAAVQLDDQAPFEAHEIHDVISQRELPAKFQRLERAAAKFLPEKVLGLGRRASEISGTVLVASHMSAPSPLAPLPRGERGARRQMSCAFAENSHAVQLDSLRTIASNRHREDRFYSSCKRRAGNHDRRATSDLTLVCLLGTFVADRRQRPRFVFPTLDGSRRGEQVAVPLQPTVHTASLGGLCERRIESGQCATDGGGVLVLRPLGIGMQA